MNANVDGSDIIRRLHSIETKLDKLIDLLPENLSELRILEDGSIEDVINVSSIPTLFDNEPDISNFDDGFEVDVDIEEDDDWY